MAYAFYLGIDAHSPDNGSAEYAFSLIEKNETNGESTYRLHDLRHLEGSPDEIAARIQERISADPFVGRTVCVANATEKEGREVQRALMERGLSPIGLSISGGDAAAQTGAASGIAGVDAGGSDGPGLQVSEHVVVSNVEEIYHDGRLELDAVKSDEPSNLVKGLDRYRLEAREPGHEGLDHIRAEPTRDTEYAELVLATGVACWLAEQHSFDPSEHLGGELPTTGEAKRELRPDTN